MQTKSLRTVLEEVPGGNYPRETAIEGHTSLNSVGTPHDVAHATLPVTNTRTLSRTSDAIGIEHDAYFQECWREIFSLFCDASSSIARAQTYATICNCAEIPVQVRAAAESRVSHEPIAYAKARRGHPLMNDRQFLTEPGSSSVDRMNGKQFHSEPILTDISRRNGNRAATFASSEVNANTQALLLDGRSSWPEYCVASSVHDVFNTENTSRAQLQSQSDLALRNAIGAAGVPIRSQPLEFEPLMEEHLMKNEASCDEDGSNHRQRPSVPRSRADLYEDALGSRVHAPMDLEISLEGLLGDLMLSVGHDLSPIEASKCSVAEDTHQLAFSPPQDVSQEHREFDDKSWPSVGSMGHMMKACHPCLFWHNGRCIKGFDCQYCHITHSAKDIRNVRPSRKTRRLLSWTAGE